MSWAPVITGEIRPTYRGGPTEHSEGEHNPNHGKGHANHHQVEHICIEPLIITAFIPCELLSDLLGHRVLQPRSVPSYSFHLGVCCRPPALILALAVPSACIHPLQGGALLAFWQRRRLVCAIDVSGLCSTRVSERWQ
jgi:hypothetical protein